MKNLLLTIGLITALISTLVPFEKSGHALFLEELDKFNGELLKFIKK